MDKAQISDRIKTFLETEFPNQAIELTTTTDLLDEWFIDSLGITETVVFLEASFGIDLTRADINGTNFKSIETLSEFVAGRLAK